MTRPAPRRLAACLAAGLLTVLLAPLAPPAGAEEGSPEVPLSVSIETLTPSTLPTRGRDTVTVTGTILNRSDSTWTDLKAYLLTSQKPIRSESELDAARATDPAAVIGSRLYEPGRYDELGNLAPGSSTHYVLTVARRDLKISGEPGVYWLGVHVLGANEDGHDGVADGRARTFIPLMGVSGPTTSMSLVVPVKAQVHRQPDGRLTNLEGWHNLLGVDGRLGRLLQLSASATAPLTWVVDPAVVDAAQSVAAGNPALNTGPTTVTPPAGQPAASPSASGSPSPAPDDSTQSSPPELSLGARTAADWVSQFRRQAAQLDVLTVPYGDLDVASVLRARLPDVYTHAMELSRQTMAALDLTTSPVVAPPSGFLPRVVLRRIDETSPVLLADRAVPAADGPVVQEPGGPRILLSSTSAGAGGPRPNPRFAALAVRQQILSVAALHALSPARDQPLVVSTPQLWDPGRDWRNADFFSGLDTDWLRAVALPSGSGEPPVDHPVRYPRRQRKAEVPFGNLLATRELVQTGNTFAGLLTLNDTVDETLAKSAMLASSVRSRARPGAAVARARGATALVRSQMQKVSIEVNPFVIMSSETGSIGVTLINKLQEPVTVGIKADTGGEDLAIRSPDPVRIGPGERASVRLRATLHDVGVHPVVLRPTNSDGTALGTATRVTVRSSQVGLVIWVIMGIGGVVLFGTAGYRIVRRVANGRRA